MRRLEMRKKVVVFGGSGFIGSSVVEELIGRGHKVVSADLTPSKYNNEVFQVCDISDQESVEQIVEGAQVVYNFAGVADLDHAIEHPVKTVALNILGNTHILEACRKHHVGRFLYASSAYAISDKGSFYGISKLASEKLVEEYYRKYGLKFTIIRYGSVYGERGYDNNYIYNLIKQAMLTKEINHSGDGKEIREYIHVADAALLAAEMIDTDQYINDYLMLTGVERMQRKELFDMINEILGHSLTINLNNDGYQNHYKTTPYSFRASRSKKLVANPFVDIGQGILDCMKDISENYEI